MAAVSLPSRVLGRKIKKFCAVFVKNVFWASWGVSYCHPRPSASLPGYGYNRATEISNYYSFLYDMIIIIIIIIIILLFI